MNQVASGRVVRWCAILKKFPQICTLMSVVALAVIAGHAQLTTTRTINGTVVDHTGAVIPRATVAITQTETKTVTQTVSTSSAGFVQVGLIPGHYAVSIPAGGFATFRETCIYVEPMTTHTVRASLKPSSVATTVAVSGGVAQVQITTAEVSSTILGEEARELPLNERNFEQLGSPMRGGITNSPVARMGTGNYSTTQSLLLDGGTNTGARVRAKPIPSIIPTPSGSPQTWYTTRTS